MSKSCLANESYVPLESDRSALLREARQGDRSALGGLLTGVEGYLRSVALCMSTRGLPPSRDASSLVQETYVRVLREFGKFRGRTEPEFLAWVRRILIFHCLKVGRKTRPMVPLRGDERFEGSPSSHAIRREESRALKSALESLPTDRRRVVELRGDASRGWDDVGRELGRSADAARVLYQRAMIQLYGLLSADHESD
jgi:RNA polymerase sigma-70 factor (ECF subfamily)